MVIQKEFIRSSNLKIGLLGENHSEVSTEQYVRLGDKKATRVRVRLLENVDLKDYTFGFEALLPKKKLVRDEDQTRFKHIGRNVFEYTFSEPLHGFVGASEFAYFVFTKADGTRVTTQNFYIKALNNAEAGAEGLQDHYVSVIDGIVESNQETMAKAQELIDIINANDVAKKTEFVTFKGEVNANQLAFEQSMYDKQVAYETKVDGKVATLEGKVAATETKVNTFDGRITAAQDKANSVETNFNTYKTSNDKRSSDLEARVSAFVNVKEFGAFGDNTNSAAKIQQALDIAKTKGGVHVHIPAGKYLIEKYMIVYANTKITMEPGTVLLRNHGGGFFKNGNTGDMYTGYNGNGNIHIEGGTLDGNVLEFTQSFNHTGWARGRNITIKNVTFKDAIFAHFLDINACDGFLVEDCRFLGYKDNTSDGSRGYAEAIQISNHTQAGYSDFGVFDGTPSKNITVRNCYFGSSGTIGMNPVACGIGNHGSVYNEYVSEVIVEGCVFEGVTYAGVVNYKYKRTKVVNNTFLNCAKGVWMYNPNGEGESGKDGAGNEVGLPQAGESFFIEGNMFNNCSEAIRVESVINTPKGDIFERARQIIISDNIINGVVGSFPSIYVGLADNVIITNNVITGAYRGIVASHCVNTSIKGNRIMKAVWEGIYVGYISPILSTVDNLSENIHVESNNVNDTGGAGISVRRTNYFSVIDNSIFGASKTTNATYSGINIGAATSLINKSTKGKVEGNYVVNTPGNQYKFGVEIATGCENVQEFNNNAGSITVSPTGGNFSGFYIVDRGGTLRRATINTDGTITFGA